MSLFPAKDAASAKSLPKAVKLVVQRCDSASLLLDNEDKWGSIGRGIVAYVSFTSTMEEYATEGNGKKRTAIVEKVAKAILNLPIVTMGTWRWKSTRISA